MAKITIPASMQSNYFYQHRHEIADVCEKNKVDIGVGLDMFIANTGIRGKYGEDLEAFKALATRFQLSKEQTVSELFA